MGARATGLFLALAAILAAGAASAQQIPHTPGQIPPYVDPNFPPFQLPPGPTDPLDRLYPGPLRPDPIPDTQTPVGRQFPRGETPRPQNSLPQGFTMTIDRAGLTMAPDASDPAAPDRRAPCGLLGSAGGGQRSLRARVVRPEWGGYRRAPRHLCEAGRGRGPGGGDPFAGARIRQMSAAQVYRGPRVGYCRASVRLPVHCPGCGASVRKPSRANKEFKCPIKATR